MADSLKNNPAALRHCLLYEFLRVKAVEDRTNEKSSIFAKYNNFCEVIGNDVMKYSEFEFWFCRFANGEFDLNYEREKDEKTYELMDMPVDVMENIVEYLDIFDRIKLARTSRSLQTLVEDQKLFHHTLKLAVFDVGANVSFGRWVNIKYARSSRTGCDKNFNKREKSVADVPFWKKTMLDLKSILKNPKLYLNTLIIRLYSKDEAEISLDDLEAALKFNHYLNVKNFEVLAESFEALMKILPSLKPGYLTSIDISSHRRNVDSMEKLFEMEQWKQAECFTMTMAKFHNSIIPL
ncbi:unnamed protein product [Caenorhabditis brenneri]